MPTQIIICTAKSVVDLFYLQIYQLVHHAMWVDSVVSWGSSFQLIYSQSLDPFLCHRIPQKSSCTIRTRKVSFHGSSLQVGFRQTSLLYGASVLNIKTEQASFLIGWTAVTMVTEEDFVSITYLKTAAPSIDQLYYHKFLIRSVSVALSVISTQQ